MEILLVDDEVESNLVMARFLETSGHNTISVFSGEEALEVLSHRDFDLLLTDYRMPGMSGVELVVEARKSTRNPFMDVVVLTAYAQIDVAVTAMKAGAYDYLDKPLHLEELGLIVDKVEQHQKLCKQHFELTNQFNEKVAQAIEVSKQELYAWKQEHYKVIGLGSMGIFSPVMRDIIEQAEMLYKRRNVCVLIEGETGTGKELLARYIHYGPLTESINTPFIAINCANLNQLLLESELFGYEPGAFTGGLPKGQIGKVDLAQGGTLFLDEINSLSMEAQSRILRLIEERQFYRVGGHRLITADVRIIAASNVDLLKSIEAHQFRADLYYRLSLAKISVPSLRERKDDILPMANMFLEQATGNPMIVPALTDAAQQALLDYAWPGNCRELKNVITYAAMLQPVGMIDVLHLGPLLTPHAPNSVIAPDQLIDYNLLPHLRLPSAAFNLQEYLDHLTTQLILEALKMQKGNRTRAAEYLGISRSALYRRMHELEM